MSIGAIHQVSISHLVGGLLEDLYYSLRNEKVKFERLQDPYGRMPSCLREYADKVMLGFDRYTAFFNTGNVGVYWPQIHGH